MLTRYCHEQNRLSAGRPLEFVASCEQTRAGRAEGQPKPPPSSSICCLPPAAESRAVASPQHGSPLWVPVLVPACPAPHGVSSRATPSWAALSHSSSSTARCGPAPRGLSVTAGSVRQELTAPARLLPGLLLLHGDLLHVVPGGCRAQPAPPRACCPDAQSTPCPPSLWALGRCKLVNCQ